MANIDKTLKAINDLKDVVVSDYEKALAESTAIARLQAIHEAKGTLNAEIKKLENFKILTSNDPALDAIGTRGGAADSALATNQGQAVQILRLLEYFKNNPDGPTPALKSEPVVPIDILRLVGLCAAISEKFETARPQLTAAMLRGVAI